jgi:tryptophanyl-tRNA synthetase
MRIFSGIQPTGRKHLGNFIGAIVQYVEGQQRAADAGDVAIFCVVDLHAMTVPWQPAEMRERVYDTAAILLAAGLDPEKCIFIRQSDVPEHTELTWTLGAVTAHGDLNRMHQFKEKSARQKELVSADLFYYPVLMAADVLAYRANEVPVGDDQRQHVELMRDVAIRFNERFGDTLVVPEHRIPTIGARIMDLQNPESKMSTTSENENGRIHVLDDPKVITKKIKSAVTDSGSEVTRGPDKAGVSNLIDILSAVRKTTPDVIEQEFEGKRYGDFKSAVAEAVVEYLTPVRERYGEIRGDEAELLRILADGADRARAIASDTLRDVRAVMGVGTSH